MRFFADLHIHSRYSMATSRDLSPESLSLWAQLKGISVVGTGDFTHPAWLSELRERLVPAGNGLFRLNDRFSINGVPESCRSGVFFIPTTEICSIYKKNGLTRKIHSLVLAPDLQAVERINSKLSLIGNLSSDGRPILKLDARELLKIVMDSSPDAMLIPAHAWTPHFSIFGARSGFDSLEECYEDLTPYIYAIETGLSSDPSMNWRIKPLDDITLVSNSDAHSPSKLGREANIFETDLSYTGIMKAIKDKKGFFGTLEFFPEEGKYHYDGHRACGIGMHPKDTIKHNNMCPVCGRKLTVGVLHRIEELAGRGPGETPQNARPFYKVVPLVEIISGTIKRGVNTKGVRKIYHNILNVMGNEFGVLLDVPVDDLSRAVSEEVTAAIYKIRQGKVNITPGYDGEFGRVEIAQNG
ncbi:hypothetical protein BMS3Abin07_00257 [bacterium BMS3Abin07]|nr:hypothetical protein BMS3Abin07_00257 [bacterium BMS3Abin07]GBE32303.1 hypothetical protein BMS3Bbin05_01213 [bacterium BMS3Bbin05]HDO23087.1 DNA helicase UvrD [Nitrospirota bacterium]HDZ88947.1 DNA helicase UvrD [Nitrospirota bacterium]